MKRANHFSRGRGVAMWYAIVLMTVLCMLLSLAVDFGRAQLVKTEMRRAADAGARAAASAILKGSGAAGDDFAGIKQLKFDKNSWTDSYRSAWGAYDPGKIRNHGTIKTNGKIKLKGDIVIHGDAHPGPRQRAATGGTVTGSREPLKNLLSYAPVYAPSDLSKDGKFEAEEKTTTYL